MGAINTLELYNYINGKYKNSEINYDQISINLYMFVFYYIIVKRVEKRENENFKEIFKNYKANFMCKNLVECLKSSFFIDLNVQTIEKKEIKTEEDNIILKGNDDKCNYIDL